VSDFDQIYQPSWRIATSFMPVEILDFLNGDDLDRKLSQAIRISTVSEDGWPHAAMPKCRRNAGARVIRGRDAPHIVTNVHASWPNHALIMGLPKDNDTRAQCFEFVKRYEQYPGKAERTKDAPWVENVIDKGVNLFDIVPLSRFNRGAADST
jgi:hypothetical protein